MSGVGLVAVAFCGGYTVRFGPKDPFAICSLTYGALAYSLFLKPYPVSLLYDMDPAAWLVPGLWLRSQQQTAHSGLGTLTDTGRLPLS